MLIKYEELLADYKTNIETNLRGFSGGPHPFETWVPYEGDHIKSINALIDLAIEAKNEVITVQASKEICGSDDNIICISPRAAKISESLSTICNDLGYTNKVKVVGLKNNVLTLDYEETPGLKPFHLSLIQIEDALNLALNEKLDIQTLNVDDKNRRNCAKK